MTNSVTWNEWNLGTNIPSSWNTLFPIRKEVTWDCAFHFSRGKEEKGNVLPRQILQSVVGGDVFKASIRRVCWFLADEADDDDDTECQPRFKIWPLLNQNKQSRNNSLIVELEGGVYKPLPIQQIHIGGFKENILDYVSLEFKLKSSHPSASFSILWPHTVFVLWGMWNLSQMW